MVGFCKTTLISNKKPQKQQYVKLLFFYIFCHTKCPCSFHICHGSVLSSVFLFLSFSPFKERGGAAADDQAGRCRPALPRLDRQAPGLDLRCSPLASLCSARSCPSAGPARPHLLRPPALPPGRPNRLCSTRLVVTGLVEKGQAFGKHRERRGLGTWERAHTSARAEDQQEVARRACVRISAGGNTKPTIVTMASSSKSNSDVRPPVFQHPLHVSDADEEDENVKQLNECAAIYLSLQDCLVNSNRNWKACQAHVQALKACQEKRNKSDKT